MKRILLVFFTLILIASGVQAQTPSQSQSSSWMRYIVKGEAFSVDFPAMPAMTVDQRGWSLAEAGRRQARRQIAIGSYAQGVVYAVYVVENPVPRQSLDSFIGEQTRWSRNKYVRAEEHPSIDDSRGEMLLFPEHDGISQFFAKDNRLYEFRAIGAPVDDPRMTKFFSSLSLKGKNDGIEVKDGPGFPPEPNGEAEYLEDGLQLLPGKEVERKVRVGMKPEPAYTDSARQNRITGTVVIKCVFRRDGRITNIRVVKDLPNGLTERAVEAARKIKFIPATKNGEYVSMWMQLEYNFNLY